MKFKILRPAIAMIELIFAIVIMGIVLMSAPMLISTGTQSTFVALQQEGINEAASRVNMIMGYAWDEQNTQENYLFPLLHTSGDSAFNESGTTARRVGIPMTSQRTFILSDANNSDLNASALGSDGGDQDDIDDFGGTSLVNIEAATAITYTGDGVTGGYNQQTVTFVPFGAPGGTTTNIKSITVNLTSTSGVGELEKEIILRAFSCNIGGYQL